MAARANMNCRKCFMAAPLSRRIAGSAMRLSSRLLSYYTRLELTEKFASVHLRSVPLRRPMLRWKATALLLLTALTLPAAAAPPPWAVESPAAAGDGARFGLGVDSFFENQKSLRIASQQSVTVLQGPDGSPQPTVV